MFRIFPLVLFSFLLSSKIAYSEIVTVQFTAVVDYEYSESNPIYFDPNGQFKWNEYDWGLDVGDSFSGTFVIDVTNLPFNSARELGHSVYRNISNIDPSLNSDFDIISSSLQNPTLNALGYNDYLEILDSGLDSQQTRDQLLMRDTYYYVDDTVYERSSIEFNLYDVFDFIDTGSVTQSFSLNKSQLKSFENNRGNMLYDFFDRNVPNGQTDNKTYNQLGFSLTSLNYNVINVSSPNSLALLLVILLWIGKKQKIERIGKVIK